MLTYVKRHWNELRGDEHDTWGTSWWYFEVDNKGCIVRQIEQYESGMRLRYDEQHPEDEFGQLAEKPLDLSVPGYSAISSQDFEAIWLSS
jgi:hypothetical protein